MLKDITFGQYFESESHIHKLDPRTKILLLIVVYVFIKNTIKDVLKKP